MRMENIMSDSEINAVLEFWFIESKPQDWFQKNPEYDADITKRFSGLHLDVFENHRSHWRNTPKGCLAEIIVLDQFPRNMFRDTPQAFASDARARDCLAHTLAHGYDKQMTQTERNFAYLPLEHSESIVDQEKSIELFTKNGDANTLEYALKHKVIIERFGRFPHRNKILDRKPTALEIGFLTEPGSSF